MQLSEDMQIKDISALESEIRTKFRDIVSGRPPYAHHSLKSSYYKKQPLHIYSMPGIPASPRYHMSVDHLSHMLTIYADDFAPILKDAIHTWILVPRAVFGDKHLLTHLYDVETGVIASYFYPVRFNDTTPVQLENRFSAQHPVQYEAPGLLHSVLNNIHRIHKLFIRENRHSSELHKFFLDLKEVEDQEIVDLQSTDDRIKLFFPDEFII